MPHKNDRDEFTDESLRQAARRVSLLEALLWISGISIALATPYWFGLSSLIVIFYGTLGALTWRLSRLVSFKLALGIAFLIAFIATAIMAPIIQNE